METSLAKRDVTLQNKSENVLPRHLQWKTDLILLTPIIILSYNHLNCPIIFYYYRIKDLFEYINQRQQSYSKHFGSTLECFFLISSNHEGTSWEIALQLTRWSWYTSSCCLNKECAATLSLPGLYLTENIYPTNFFSHFF